MIRTLIALLALCLTITAPVAVAQTVCDADVQRDGYIDGADLTVILGSWGPCAACAGDISGDHFVDGVDLAIVLARWGGSCVPTISAVSPNNGPASGGTAITITGTGFQGTSNVLIGGTPATNVVVVNSTTVTAVTPLGTAGAKTVSLTTPGGTSSLAGGFIYTTWYTILELAPNPAVVTNAALRTAITATGYPWHIRDNETLIDLVLIPPGTFDMGCSASTHYACHTDEVPVHAVTINHAYYLGRFEVTQTQWESIMGTNPSYFKGSQYPDAQNRPVERVSWSVIQNFLSAAGMRLPTEAEWEYAYRGGTTSAYHGWPAEPTGTNDDALVGSIAWWSGNNGAVGTATYGTKAVGQKAANGLGLHDMAGNVWELLSDWYVVDYYTDAPVTDPQGPPMGTYRALRGGAWGGYENYMRASYRSGWLPNSTDYSVGFRVARNP